MTRFLSYSEKIYGKIFDSEKSKFSNFLETSKMISLGGGQHAWVVTRPPRLEKPLFFHVFSCQTNEKHSFFMVFSVRTCSAQPTCLPRGQVAPQVTPREERDHRVCVTEARKKIKIPFVNGVKKCLADLISGPLDHNLHVGEGIKMFL